MKKSLLLIPFLFISFGLFAQEGFKIGLRFSPIVSFASVADKDNNSIPGLEKSGKIGLSYGLMVNYGFNDNYGLHSGIHLVNKGFTRNQSINGTATQQSVRVSTVEIPLAVKGRSNELGVSGIYINGLFGISIDITTGYKNDYEGINPFTGAVGSGTSKKKEFVNPLAFSFLFGAGTDIELDIGTINTGLIFHRGLTNLNNRNKVGNEETIKISYLSLDLGYFF
jgi:hypothetical protein